VKPVSERGTDAEELEGPERDVDVVVVGSGFGGSVAALRFADAGERTVVIERGPHVRRESFEADPDMFWSPRRHRFGINHFRPLGRHIIPWMGAGVGGGSHVYAATLKRRAFFDDFPVLIDPGEMADCYAVAEEIMDAQPYPDHPPYSEVRATDLLYDAGEAVARARPDLVEDWGAIDLGISFAPPDGVPGAEFVNKHGARQRYSNPREHSLLGGGIDAKNSLDRNYLHLAEASGAEIRPLSEVDRIEPLDSGGYRVHYTRYVVETSRWRRIVRNWLPGAVRNRDERRSITTRRVVVAAGSVGSTEILLRNRDAFGTLPDLSPALGDRYSSNGDYVSLMLPFRGFFAGWAGFLAAVVGAVVGNVWVLAAGAALYLFTLTVSRPAFDPDIGVTNSDFIRFRGRDGRPQGAYVEGGRYPTPLRALLAFLLSVAGRYRPGSYAWIIRVTGVLRRWVPPFELIARSWPIPLLEMGRDDATGRYRLDSGKRLTLDYDFEANADFYRWLDELGRMVAKAADAWWLPNVPARLLKRVEIPHNLGGAPMGPTPAEGVVDDAGRVYGYDDLMVLDGSIVPVALGPNPALTILALSERAMRRVLDQIDEEGVVRATATAPPRSRP